MIFYKKMTQEDRDYLKEYETNFKTAINGNYTRNLLKSVINRMLEIYEKETGIRYNLCTHCPTSVLNFLKKIGKIYFEEVQGGNEPPVEISELEKTVAKKENKKEKTIKKNGKYTSGKV